MIDNYPPGTTYFDENAPYNENKWEQEPKEIEVTVSITLSKTVKVQVDDYKVEESIDEEGNHFTDIDYSECNLKDAVEQQVSLPHEVASMTKALGIVKDWKFPKTFKQSLEEADNWVVDDFEVIQE